MIARTYCPLFGGLGPFPSFEIEDREQAVILLPRARGLTYWTASQGTTRSRTATRIPRGYP